MGTWISLGYDCDPTEISFGFHLRGSLSAIFASTLLLDGSPQRMRLLDAMSASVSAVSVVVRASPRYCWRQWSIACCISLAAQEPTFSFSAGPVGFTMMKLSMKASSIGPWRPCFLRRPASSSGPATHLPPDLWKHAFQDLSPPT